jgi:pSer/pThr/pTyr-binding forkhead associated (FHA) protein
MRHLGRSAPAPSPWAPGTIVVVESGKPTTFIAQPGQRLVIGRDEGADIVLGDQSVSARHTQIERLGPGWIVSSLDPDNPTWILDPTGRAQPIETELGLRSGELLIGTCQVMLYPPAAEPSASAPTLA